MNHRDVDWLFGRRFVADAQVLSVGDGEGEAREVKLQLNGRDAVISLGELWMLIEEGFVIEAGPPGEGRVM